MITAVKTQNGSLKLFEYYGPLVITSVEGCASYTATPNFSKIVGGYETMTSYQSTPKTITIKYRLAGWGAENETGRNQIYNVFPPNSWVELELTTDRERVYKIGGFVEKIENTSYTAQTEGLVSIICPYPYFVQVSGPPRDGVNPKTIHKGYEFQFPIEREPINSWTYEWPKQPNKGYLIRWGDAPSYPILEIMYKKPPASPNLAISMKKVSTGERLPLFSLSRSIDPLRTASTTSRITFNYRNSQGALRPQIMVGYGLPVDVLSKFSTRGIDSSPVSFHHMEPNETYEFVPEIGSDEIDLKVGGIYAYAAI